MTAGTHTYAFSQGRTPATRLQLDTVLCIGILLWLTLGTFMQDHFFRLFPGTAAAFTILFLVAARSALAGSMSTCPGPGA